MARGGLETVPASSPRPKALLFILLPPGQAGPALLERERLRALLTEFGWEVTAARTLDDAVRCLGRGLADLFVCDLGVPLARQARTLDRCRRAGSGVPFLLLSPLVSPEEASVAARHGAVVYKPASPLDLLEALESLLHPPVPAPAAAGVEAPVHRPPASPLTA